MTSVSFQAPPIVDTRHARFEALLQAHRGVVFKVARTYCLNPDDRDDLAQDITAQLWRAFDRYDGQRPFSTWMYRIALNVAISQVRTRSLRERHHVPLDESHDVADTHDSLEADARLRVLEGFLATLGPLDRALLLLYLEEHGHREIGEVLGLSETNVATKIGRLKQRLRRHVEA